MVKIYKVENIDLNILSYRPCCDDDGVLGEEVLLEYDNHPFMIQAMVVCQNYKNGDLLINLSESTQFFEDLDRKLFDDLRRFRREWFPHKKIKGFEGFSKIDAYNNKNAVARLPIIKSKNFKTLLFLNDDMVPNHDYSELLKSGVCIKVIIEFIGIKLNGESLMIEKKLHQIKINRSRDCIYEFTEESMDDFSE